MSIEVLLVQMLVLVFTGVLWWIARRDLAARSAPPPAAPNSSADTAELEQLCATLEALVTSLARRLDAVERQPVPRQSALEVFPPMEPMRSIEPIRPMEPLRPMEPMRPMEPLPPAPFNPAEPAPEPVPTPELIPDPRYAPVYALLDAGVSDPVEITQRTGLGRGEVDLILSLKARKAF